MRKVVIHRAGGYERLRIEEHPSPVPKPGEVLVDVEAIGVNYADCVVRMGLYASAKKYVGWPITPGFEVAGRRRDTGEPCVAVTRFGGYATELVVPEHQVFSVPAGFSLVEAAAFPTVFMTAWFGLVELANPSPGRRVLVHSAAGGVGSALVQLEKILDLEGVGVVGRTHKVATVEALGADAVIDKSVDDLWTAAARLAPEGYHVILDANGVATLKDSYRHLAPPGKLVVYGFHTMMPKQGGRPSWPKLIWGWLRTPRFNPLDMTGDNKSVLAFNLSYLFQERDVLVRAADQLWGWAGENRLVPSPTTTFPLERVADAHRALESGETVGKLVLLC